MKKVVRMLGLCALVALAFTACKKNDTQKVTFTGYAAQPTGDVRTHISDGTFLVWSENDQIKVFNEAGDDNMDFTVQSSAGKPGVAVFTADDADEIAFVADLETADYTAFYPNAVVNEDDKVVMAIPAEQEYFSGKEIANNLYPMVGYNDGTNFLFQSNAGFLYVAFAVSNDSEIDTYTIDKLVLRAKDEADILSCNMIYEKDGLNYSLESTGNVVTLSGAPVVLEKGNAKNFTFVLPEGALYSGFDVELYNGDELVESFEGQGNGLNRIVAQQFRTMPDAYIPRPVPQPAK